MLGCAAMTPRCSLSLAATVAVAVLPFALDARALEWTLVAAQGQETPPGAAATTFGYFPAPPVFTASGALRFESHVPESHEPIGVFEWSSDGGLALATGTQLDGATLGSPAFTVQDDPAGVLLSSDSLLLTVGAR